MSRKHLAAPAHTHSRIAQSAERRSPKPKVQGSTPCAAARSRKVAGEAERRCLENRWTRRRRERSNRSPSAKSRPASSEDESTGLRSRGSHVRIVRGAPTPGLRAELVTAAACKAVALAACVVRVHGNPPASRGHGRLVRHLCSTQTEAGSIPAARSRFKRRWPRGRRQQTANLPCETPREFESRSPLQIASLASSVARAAVF